MRTAGAAAVLIVLIHPPLISAVEIILAPIVQEGDSPQSRVYSAAELSERLIQSVILLDTSGDLKLRLGELPVGDEPVSSVLDAAEFAAFNGSHALFYGRFNYSDTSIDAVIRFFDPVSTRIASTIYGRDSANRQERLIEDIGGKIYVHLTETLGLEPGLGARGPEKGVWHFRFGGGYWRPLPPWGDALSGTGTGELALYLTPVYPAFGKARRLFGFRFGISGVYSFAMNTPSSEPILFHASRFGIPMEFTVEFRETHRIGLGVNPILMLDAVSQQHRHVPGRNIALSLSMGTAFTLYYRLSFNPGHALGLSAEAALIFYDPLRFELRPTLFYEHRLGWRKTRRRSS